MVEDFCFCFFGNVVVGEYVQFGEFFECYDVVIYVVGVQFDCMLNIFGEDLLGSIVVVDFVGWYNVYLYFEQVLFDLLGVWVVVIGNGNVVLDVVWILFIDFDVLVCIDIVDYVLELLCLCGIQEVVIVGC